MLDLFQIESKIRQILSCIEAEVLNVLSTELVDISSGRTFFNGKKYLAMIVSIGILPILGIF